MPMKRSGWAVTEASRVIEIDEVLEATIVSGLRNGAQVGEDLALDVLALGGRLDHEIAVGEIVERRRDADPVKRRLAAGFVELALGDLARQQAVDRRERRLDALFGDVVEQHVQSGLGADQRDAGAHLAGADDADFVDRGSSAHPERHARARERS